MKYPLNFRRVVENIYAGAAPNPEQMQQLISDFNIKFVLSLDEASGKRISPLLLNNKILQIFIPILPTNQINDSLKYLIRNINQIFSNQPLFIHCQQGQDRTGLAIAIYRILKYKWNKDQAILEGKRFGFGNGVSKQTQEFWNNLLTSLASNKNPADVQAVEDMALNLPYPFVLGTLPTNYPEQFSVPEPDPKEELETELDEDIPLVGIYNNMGPIKGTGPVENSGIMFNWGN